MESANARIKRFKMLATVLPCSQVPYIGDFVKIVCAICNKYLPPLCSTSQNEADTQVAQQMLLLAERANVLQRYVLEHGLDRKLKVWKSVKEVVFPRLSVEKLHDLTLGVYQLKLASSYIQEHLSGMFDIHIHVDDASLLTVRLQSRHSNSRRYLIWIQSSETEIEAWYCQCRAGARVVGMCAHVAAIVWYLAFARHQESTRYGVRDWSENLADASTFQIEN